MLAASQVSRTDGNPPPQVTKTIAVSDRVVGLSNRGSRSAMERFRRETKKQNSYMVASTPRNPGDVE